MAAKNPEFQTQCLDLIRGIKAAHEKQNDLLEKLVTLMAIPAELETAHLREEKCHEDIDESLARGDKTKLDEGASSDDLSVAAQQDTNLGNILRFASHSYKKRLQLFETGQDGPQPFVLSSQLPPSQSSYTLHQQLEYIPRPPDDGDVVVNATRSWNYCTYPHSSPTSQLTISINRVSARLGDTILQKQIHQPSTGLHAPMATYPRRKRKVVSHRRHRLGVSPNRTRYTIASGRNIL
jgi:hypothetical protein